MDRVKYINHLSLLIIIVIGSCINEQKIKSNNMTLNSLADRLITIGYRNLFMRGDQSLADSIWNEGKSETMLNQIINKPNISLEAKFLSAEVLRHFNVESVPENRSVLPKAYVDALVHSSVDREDFNNLNGNLWGFLYNVDDAGYLGQQLVSYGDESLIYLFDLLDDEGRVIYEGSQEATIGNEYQYRIKDFAAFYISKIKNIPIQFYKKLDDRDREIEILKNALKAE